MRREAVLLILPDCSGGGFVHWNLDVNRPYYICSNGNYATGHRAAIAAHTVARSLGITITATEGLD